MSDPPKKKKKPGVFDAIPTEDEGDALFDELFGALEEEDDDIDGATAFAEEVGEMEDGDDRPTAEVYLSEDGPVAEPPRGDAPPPPPRPDLPPPPRPDEPYAEPYEDLPPVVESEGEETPLAAEDATRPGPAVFPRATGDETYRQAAGERPLQGLGEPVPSNEELQIPAPDDDDVPLVVGEGDEAVVVAEEVVVAETESPDDDAAAEAERIDEVAEVAPLDDDDDAMEVDDDAVVDVPEGEVVVSEEGAAILSEPPPPGTPGLDIADLHHEDVELSEEEAALLAEDGAFDEVAVEEGFAFVEEGEGQDAVVNLMQQGQRDVWVDRAEWLYREAPAPEARVERARALLVVVELLAMAGEEDRAEEVARESLELAPELPLAHRALRGVLMGRGRWTEVTDALDAEARVAPTPAAKHHALYLGAEVSRLALGDPDGSNRRLDQAERIVQEDVRVPLARVMQTLSADDEAPRKAGHDALEPALDPITVMRSDGNDGEGAGDPYSMVLKARSGLRQRNLTQVAAALRLLAEHEPFGPGANWVIAALGATSAGLREEALSALESLVGGSHGPLAQRWIAARALEGGHPNKALEMAREGDADVFSPAERIVIGTLAGKPAEVVPWLDNVAEELRPIAAAASAQVHPLDGLSRAGGDEWSSANVALGRLLAREPKREQTEEEPGFSQDLLETADNLVATDPGHGAGRAVLVEHAHATGQVDRVITMMAGDAGTRERGLFAALLAETVEDQEAMAEHLAQAAADAPGDEATIRMQMAVVDGVAGANALANLANAVVDEVHASIALTEAGLRLMEEEGHEAQGEQLLQQASRRDGWMPVAPFIGMYIAQALEDGAAELFWLEQRRTACPDPADAVGDLVRHALRLPVEEQTERSNLLEEAHRNRPDDYGLRDLYERVAGTAPDHAAWLLERAEQGGPEAATAAIEAAITAELDGDVEQAASSGARAMALGESRLSPVLTTRYAELGFEAGPAIERLSQRAESSESSSMRASLQLQIARIARLGTNDDDRAMEALRLALAEDPEHLPTLHAISAQCRRLGTTDGLGGVSLAIAKHIDGPERVGHAALAARLILETRKWEDTFEAVKIAYEAGASSLWAKREMAAHARAKGDHALASSIDNDLARESATQQDQATLLLRAAQSALAAGDEETASSMLAEALETWPRHLVALLERAAQLERLGAASEAAKAWEELALTCQSERERAANLYRAAVQWLSRGDATGQKEGRRLLEAVTEIDPNYGDTFDRLQAIYLATGAKRELADLLGQRIVNVEDEAERIELEVLRGRMLVEAGDPAEARESLAAALEASPDNTDALRAFAEVCAADGDWEGVEQALIRLGRLVSDPEEQVKLHLRLGNLYSEHLPNSERAEAAYDEVLRREPSNVEARERLVTLYLDVGDTEKAFAQQEKLVDAASTPSEKCVATVRLAEIHEVAGDAKKAEQMLVRARRQWNKEPAPVASLYRFYQRTGQDQAADMLLERAAADVRRGLGAGRFEAPLFAMAQMVADMRGLHDSAKIAGSTLAAIEGEDTYITGIGDAAAEAALDPEIAPDVFTEPFRQLLAETGPLMEAAAPFDMGSLRAKPLGPAEAHVDSEIQQLASAYGLGPVEVMATNALGRVCIPAQTSPPTLCLGLNLVTAPEAEVRTFLIHRALKVIQTGTAALSRTAPIDLWPLLAAWLKIHSSSFAPQGVDAQKVAAYHQAMSSAGVTVTPHLSALASDIITNIGNRASSLSTLASAWGSRAALLALGDPNVALLAIAWAGGTQAPPASGQERLRWIGRQAEARDLIVFSVSDDYNAIRKRMGVEVPDLADKPAVDTDDEVTPVPIEADAPFDDEVSVGDELIIDDELIVDEPTPGGADDPAAATPAIDEDDGGDELMQTMAYDPDGTDEILIDEMELDPESVTQDIDAVRPPPPPGPPPPRPPGPPPPRADSEPESAELLELDEIAVESAEELDDFDIDLD